MKIQQVQRRPSQTPGNELPNGFKQQHCKPTPAGCNLQLSPRKRSGVHSVSAGVVLNGAGSLDGGGLVDEGIAVNAEWSFPSAFYNSGCSTTKVAREGLDIGGSTLLGRRSGSIASIFLLVTIRNCLPGKGAGVHGISAGIVLDLCGC